MANKINPITGKLDTVRSDEEIEAIASAAGGVQSKIEGTGGGIVTDTADYDTTGALNSLGQFQVQDTNGDGLMQLTSNQMVYGKRVQQLVLETGVDYSVARNWLFNSKTSHRERITKVTMQASDPTKEVSLFTGSNGGYNITIYFGNHVNHQAPFTIVCPGTGIVGHPSGIVMDTPGQAVTLQQIGSSEYVVIGASFDLSGGGGGAATPEDEHEFIGVSETTDNNNTIYSITGCTIGKKYRLDLNLKGGSIVGTPLGFQIKNGAATAREVELNDKQDAQFSCVITATTTTIDIVALTSGGVASWTIDLDVTEMNNTITTAKF